MTISADDDATLIHRVRAGDTDAYGVLVRRHAPMAVRTAVLLGAGSDAEDVVQEALVKAYGSLDGFHLDRPFRPWLLRIVANEARNAHRAALRRSAREERDARGLAAWLDDPSVDVTEREAKEAVLAAVSRLPETLRRAVVCRYLLELSEAETAVVLAVPRGTVKSRLSRGLRRLRADLGATMEEVDHA